MQIIKSVLSFLLLSTALLLHAFSLQANASEIRISPEPSRSASVLLDGASLVGNTHIFVESTQDSTKQVRFYLDTSTSTSPTKIENLGPYDFAGTHPDDSAIAFDTNTILDGYHTLTVELENNTGSIEVLESQFLVANNEPSLLLGDALLSTRVTEGTPSATLSTTLTTNDGSSPTFTASESTSWLDINASSSTTPATINILLNTSSLPPGNYASTVSFTAAGLAPAELTVSLLVTPESTGSYQLLTSMSDDRSSPSALAGTALRGDAHIFISPEEGVKQVRFYVDKSMSGTPTKIENVKPFDLNGTKTNNNAIPLDTHTLSDGAHTLHAKVILDDSSEEVLTANFDVVNASKGFIFSPSSVSESLISGESPIAINVLLGLNAAADGSSPLYNAVSSESWLSVSPASSDAPETLTVTLDAAGLSAGNYSANIQVSSPGFDTAFLPISLTVSNDSHALQVDSNTLNIASQPNKGHITRTVNLSTSDSASTHYSISSDSAWLTASSASGFTPEDITINVDTNALAIGSHQGVLTITASAYDAITVVVNASIASNDKCAPVICSDIKVSLPYELNFDTDSGHINDKNNIGTGFTYVQPSSLGGGLLANNIELDTDSGALHLTTTQGIQYLGNNNLNNALGVGFAGPNQIADISTTLISPPKGDGKFEQAGLWLGFDEDHYIKLILLSTPAGSKVELAYENEGVITKTTSKYISDVSASDITFRFIATPSSKTVSGYYSINGGEEHKIDTFTISPEMFSFDAAGIDPEIGTRTFAGIFVTSRHNASPITYAFDHFTIVESFTPPDGSSLDFTRKSYGLSFPTSMVWAPDGRLYVTELFGTIHALTYDNNLNVIDDEILNGLTDKHGGRLTLGITLHHDNISDPNDFSLWVSHSSPSVDNGLANSGTVTKLSGPGFTVAEDIITGLPRAKANHAPNSLHFGPDDRLYIAIGGNTGAGAPVTVPTEFGDREEQPLSAALVVADVFSPSFDGSCANNSDIYGPAPCDVMTYSTGLRNTYDFVFHSSGHVYAPDNGLGVTGAFPAQPYPDCSGFASADPWNAGGQNPLEQPDLLQRLQEGKFYGHPNPSIDECIFKDGSYQGVTPSLNYEPPMAIMGSHTSSNGIIEYKSNTACGQLKGNLLITNYSLGDNIVRVVLNETGDGVVYQDSLVGSFNDPLTLSENTTGDLFVAEFGNGKITSLRPISNGCWESLSNSPIALLDTGSTSSNGDLYTVGGKTASGPVNSLYKYSTNSDTWTQLAEKPGAPVENPAAVALGNSLYVFGGSTRPFSGAVSNAYKYDITNDTWSTIANMPTARGGIRAEVINGLIYIVGGMDDTGQSINVLEIYHPLSDSWSSGPAMAEARDNPGTAVINDKLYVIGGRERTSSGVTINGTKSSGEVYDPLSNSWNFIANMPTGRRTMVTSTLNEKIQVIGGEYNDSDPDAIFNQNEEYDPIYNTWTPLPVTPYPRHGAAFSTIDNVLFINGGGDKGGSSFTNTTAKFTR
ncbi:Kelch repeat-containing protein [Alkalimarinus alittae]|uniref:PQQ-dependent sugar dehydrogenase n=1 Tax=Alkalimarinus alittae TaxID=2961619 RepID=A0ABY6MX36_9ALTE|nr:kelch repeat-containing protein [Alkalimarinus alittae]UZE94367.1 PQQ-dependent sugar dehydrogenase [Alkalimarinus alittae]